jgi:hypothetical protein
MNDTDVGDTVAFGIGMQSVHIGANPVDRVFGGDFHLYVTSHCFMWLHVVLC